MFGWEALVAIGTIFLALVTAGLAWSTRRLAAATASEVEAQRRPILVPVEGTIEMFETELDGYAAELPEGAEVWVGGFEP
jgi:hypothetical protein